jgi:hypothetical protein
MKKILLFLLIAVLTSCSTIKHVYGVVEDGVIVNNDYYYKVWTGDKYYTVISDSLYQIGSKIRVK